MIWGFSPEEMFFQTDLLKIRAPRSENGRMKIDGELLKVGWDLFTIRHYKRQGMLLFAGDYVVAIGYVIFLYATGVPAALSL